MQQTLQREVDVGRHLLYAERSAVAGASVPASCQGTSLDINFRYPMIRSEDLSPDRPEKVKMLGLHFAVCRNAAREAIVLSNTGVHRGGSPSGPWELGAQPRIVEDCLVRPCHGRAFAADGSCVSIPSAGYGTKRPGRARVVAYPAIEKYGIVFAFLGDLPAKATSASTRGSRSTSSSSRSTMPAPACSSSTCATSGSTRSMTGRSMRATQVIAQQDIDIPENVHPRRTPLRAARRPAASGTPAPWRAPS